MKESFLKVNTKNLVTKRAARGVNEEKAATLALPVAHQCPSRKVSWEQGLPQSPSPGWAGSQLTCFFGGWQEPSQPQGWEQG